ncbi:MAG: gliding motility-associated C-terminal domain-containing protein [Brumimicrobium sp.]
MCKTLYISFILLLTSLNAFAQRGVLGNETIGTQDTWVNTYTYLTTDATAGATSIDVDDSQMSGALFTTDLDEGDLILIIQMQGATVDINTTPTTSWGSNYTVQNSWITGSNPDWDQTEFGQVLDYNNAGNYEFVEVQSVGTGTITLNCGLDKNYDESGHVQVVRIPRFEDLTVPNNTSITGPDWNGFTGGIVSIEVNGELEIIGSGRIHADEIGFRGGEIDGNSALTCDLGGTGYLGSYDNVEGSEKGEGIAGFYTEYDNLESRYCRGAVANGGGGANYHNAGGGGGSNVGVGTFYGYGVADATYAAVWDLENTNLMTNPSSGGGRGGYSNASENEDPATLGPNNSNWGSDCRRPTGGTGGHALTYDSQKVFLGGGGGAGDDNNGYGGDGGRGGGAVMLQLYGNTSGTGSITANGEDGADATGPAPGWGAKTGDDGSGGAGGGGSIHISNANPIPGGIDLIATGGKGGDQFIQVHFASSNQADGPGGGGAGGLIAFSSGTPTQNVAGGDGGTTNSSFMTNFPLNGATGGANGIDGQSTDHFDLVAENDTVCGGGSTSLTANVNGTLPSGASIEWYDAQYGGTNLGSGATYNTPSLTSNATYYVGVCPGTFRIPVEVIVSPDIVITGAPPTISPETCNGNDGSITGLTASGGFGTLTFDWNGNTTPTEDLTNAVGDDYTLTVTDENGCTETSGIHTIPPSPGPSIDISNIVIQDETCLGNDGSITGIVATGSNITIEWNGNIEPDEDLTGLSGGSYTIEVTDDVNCTSSAGPFTVNTDSGPTIDDSNVSLTDETCFGDDGEITGISVTGTNLTYEWNGIETSSQDTIGVSADDYTLVITDGSGCTATSGPYTINEIPGPVVDDTNIVISDEGCNQGNGSITGITATGNNLSYVWNGTVEPQIDILNLSSGAYTLEVVDDLGCSVTVGPYNIQNIPDPVIDLSNIEIEDVTCNGGDGSITGITSSGNGLTYEWNGNSSPSIDLENVIEGDYILEVTDENGCSSVEGPFTIDSIPSPAIDDANVSISDETCYGNDGAITGLQATGNGLTYEWNGLSSQSINSNDLQAGTYNLEVIDVNGCSTSYGPVEIEGAQIPSIIVTPQNVTIENGESVDLLADITPSTSSISWLPSSGLSCDNCEDPVATVNESSWFVATVTSPDGCERSDSVFIEVEDPCGEVVIPTVFSPNDDGINDKLCVLGGCVQEVNLQIFNRWGEKIFETIDENDCWDGTFNGEKVNTGTYIYKLRGVRVDGTEFEDAGNLNVLK